MARISMLLQRTKIAQGIGDPMAAAAMGAGAPTIDPMTGMPIDPATGTPLGATGGGMASMQDPMAAQMMGGAMSPATQPMSMTPMMDPMAIPQVMPMPAEAMAVPGMTEEENSVLKTTVEMADKALELAKMQTDKIDAMSSQMAGVLSASGAIDSITPDDLQNLSAERQAAQEAETVQ